MSYIRTPTNDIEAAGQRPMLHEPRSFPPRIPAPQGPHLPPANAFEKSSGFSPLIGQPNPFERDSYVQDNINQISPNDPNVSSSFNRDQVQSPNSEIPLLSEKSRSQYYASGIPPPVLHDLSHPFRRGEQIWILFKSLIGRLVLSVTIAVCLGGVLHWYQKSGVLGDTAKYNFNAAFTGLSICLGLNVASSFKDMASIFRWRVLTSSRGHSVKELDLVLGMSSYQKCWILLGHWWRKPKHFVPLLGWVLLGIGIQIAVAVLGLTQNLDETYTDRLTTPGKVNITLIDNFYAKGLPTDQPSPQTQNYRSHVFGETGDMYIKFGPETEKGNVDVVYSPRRKNQGHSYRYHFREYVSRSGEASETIYHTSARYVDITSQCYHSYITEGYYGDNSTAIKLSPAAPILLATARNYGVNATKSPYSWLEVSIAATIYVNPSVNHNDEKGFGFPDTTCGKRCGYVEIFRFVDFEEGRPAPGGNAPTGDYFVCETTVTPVRGTKIELVDHQLSDTMAVRVASSIGATNTYSGDDLSGAQQINYGSGSAFAEWDTSGKDAIAEAEDHVARFAAGTIAMLDQVNPRIEADGDRPWTGVYLTVKWHYFYAIMGIVVGLQVIIGALTISSVRNVYCYDDSNLVAARLLRSTVDRMGDRGTAARAEQLYEFYEDDVLKYGVISGEECTDGLDRLGILSKKINEKIASRPMEPRQYYA